MVPLRVLALSRLRIWGQGAVRKLATPIPSPLVPSACKSAERVTGLRGLPLENSRRYRRLPSLSPCATPLVGLAVGWCGDLAMHFWSTGSSWPSVVKCQIPVGSVRRTTVASSIAAPSRFGHLSQPSPSKPRIQRHERLNHGSKGALVSVKVSCRRGSYSRAGPTGLMPNRGCDPMKA